MNVSRWNLQPLHLNSDAVVGIVFLFAKDASMPRIVSRSFFLTLVIAVFAAQGCNDGPDAPQTAAHDTHDGSDHSDHGHDEHAHPTEGPHHGMLVELGNEEYHAEIVHDDAAATLTVYLLDSAGKEAVMSESPEVVVNIKGGDKPQQFKLAGKADDQSEGKYSEYSFASKELLDALHAESSVAKLSITIDGKPYSGELPHDDHAGHDHAH